MYDLLSKIRYRLLSAKLKDYADVKLFVRCNNGHVIRDEKLMKVAFACSGRKLLASLRYNSSDAKVFKQVFMGKEYESLVNVFLKSPNTNKPVIVVDLGANIGLTALYLASLLRIDKYIALEPAEGNYALLKANLKNNGLINFLSEPLAIWDKSTLLAQSNDFRDGLEWSTSFKEKMPGDGNTPITGISLADLMLKHELRYIDVLKIDIEGAEFKLFEPGADLSWLPKVRFIAIELHADAGDVQSVKSRLVDYGFVLSEAGESTIGINMHY